MSLPGFIEDIGPVCGRQLDQTPVIDPAVDRSAGGTDIQEQVPAGVFISTTATLVVSTAVAG
jgi:hypothetical protein